MEKEGNTIFSSVEVDKDHSHFGSNLKDCYGFEFIKILELVKRSYLPSYMSCVLQGNSVQLLVDDKIVII